MTSVHDHKRGQRKLLFYPENRSKPGNDILLSVPLEKQTLEQGDMFGFQLHTGNKLYDDVSCLGNTLTE